MMLDSKPHYTTDIKALHSTKFARYAERKPRPGMKPHHKKEHRKFAVAHLNRIHLWPSVLFTVEEKFNLDGPDGYRYYWHDLRSKPQMHSKQVSGDVSLMVWIEISFYGETDIVFLEGEQTAATYVRVLKQIAIPYMENLCRLEDLGCVVFQHDNASIHSAHTTKQLLRAKGVSSLILPAKSPDL